LCLNDSRACRVQLGGQPFGKQNTRQDTEPLAGQCLGRCEIKLCWFPFLPALRRPGPEDTCQTSQESRVREGGKQNTRGKEGSSSYLTTVCVVQVASLGAERRAGCAARSREMAALGAKAMRMQVECPICNTKLVFEVLPQYAGRTVRVTCTNYETPIDASTDMPASSGIRAVNVKSRFSSQLCWFVFSHAKFSPRGFSQNTSLSFSFLSNCNITQ